MAEGVRVDIRDELIISALNTPGGDVNEWRNETAEAILQVAFLTSPVNNVLDARHRGGVVGTFKVSWYVRRGGNQHRVRAEIGNVADHALYVEEGRSMSNEFQRFSWTRWGGQIRDVGGLDAEGRPRSGTRARPGKHILKNAVNGVMPAACGGAYTPLP